MPARCGIVQQASAGLGRHCFASDDWFQPVLLCGLFAAPSGFHKNLLFSNSSNLQYECSTPPNISCPCTRYATVPKASSMPLDKLNKSREFAEQGENLLCHRGAVASLCTLACGSFPNLPMASCSPSFRYSVIQNPSAISPRLSLESLRKAAPCLR